MNFGKKMTGRDIAGYLLLALSVILLGRSLTLCFSNDIWYDELFTVGMAEHSYGEMVRFTAADVHPPLYYCIVKLFADLCKLIAPEVGTIIPAKIVSVLPYFVLLLYAVTFIRKRFGMFTGGMFLFCVTAMPQLSAYTVEVRMYGWALLFVTAAFLHAGELVWPLGNLGVESGVCVAGVISGRSGADEADVAKMETRRKTHGRPFHAAAFVLYGLAAAYTQYFACVAVVMVYFWLLLAFWFRDRWRIREWFFYVVVSVICYVPWLYALAGQLGAVSENYWILPLTWRTLGGCVKFLMKPAFTDDRVNTILAVILFAAYLGLWCQWMIKLCHKDRVLKKDAENGGRKEKSGKYVGREEGGNPEYGKKRAVNPGADKDGTEERFWLATAGVGVLAGLVAFGFVASFLIRPVFVYRYMIPAAGCFWIGFALCLNELLCKFQILVRKDNGIATTEEELCKLNIACQREVKCDTGRHNIGRNTISRAIGILITLFVVVVGLRDYRAFMGEEEYKIRLMAETEKALALIGPNDSVIYNFDQVQAVTGYYLPETTARFLWQVEGEKLIQEITSPCGTVENVDKIKEMTGKKREGKTTKSIWFIGSFNSREDIVTEWRDAGLEVEETGSFLLERYWFNLYKIS